MTHDHYQARSYGGWRRSRSIGLLGLGPTATLILLGCAVALLVVAATSLKTLLFVAPPALLAGAASLVRVGRVPIAQLGVLRLRWWHGTSAGHTSYRAEVVLRHTGVLQLPGTLAATELLSAEDGYGSRYGLVRDRHTGFLTATLRVVPASTWLAEPGEVDGWVANWGAWLASLGYLPALRWVTVTVDTAPDPGSTLTGRIAAAIDPAAPGRRCTSWTSWWPPPRRRPPTWTPGSASPSTPPPSPPGREQPPRRSRKWGAPCPGWNQRSARAASPCSPALGPPTSPEWCGRRSTRRSGARSTGSSPPEPGPRWKSSSTGPAPGPAGAEEAWDCYRHGSGTSVIWAWREAPRQNVHSDVLARLTHDGAGYRPGPQPPPNPATSPVTVPLPSGDADPLPPAWGWTIPDAGRAACITPRPEYQATTTQLCGLYPFVAGSGTPTAGTPVGRHQLWGEVVCLDPLAWLRAGLVTNPGMFVLGQPGTGKSALVKRLVTGAVAVGTRVLVLGDTKPDYTRLVAHLGGQVIRIGRGLDKINPLDAGPLGTALARMTGPDAERLRQELRSRRLSLLLALATLVREARISNAEEVILGRAIDLLDERLAGTREPTVADVLNVIEDGPDTLRSAARADTPHGYRARVADLVFTLDLLCTGSLARVFDGATSQPIDLDAPAVWVDISAVKAAGDKLLTAAMLCTWSYGFGCVDAAAALADLGAGPRRPYLAVMDELWRALRGAPGLVEHADSLTRLNRAKGMASIMITHSLADLDALASPEDRAKARGFVDRSAITLLAGLPPRELARVGEITPLTGPERALVTSWSAPESYPARRTPPRPRQIPDQDRRTARHPGPAHPRRPRAAPL